MNLLNPQSCRRFMKILGWPEDTGVALSKHLQLCLQMDRDWSHDRSRVRTALKTQDFREISEIRIIKLCLNSLESCSCRHSGSTLYSQVHLIVEQKICHNQ